MPSLLERVADTAALRKAVDADLRTALREAREFHTWAELATVAGLSPSGVRKLIDPREQERCRTTKGEKP